MDITKDILLGKWHEFKGRARQQWSKLTNDDLTWMNGKTEELDGLYQQHYGHSKAQAQTKINNWRYDRNRSC
jgi:uncharacterized protein YjbJ (UPF0337 family)